MALLQTVPPPIHTMNKQTWQKGSIQLPCHQNPHLSMKKDLVMLTIFLNHLFTPPPDVFSDDSEADSLIDLTDEDLGEEHSEES